MPFPRPLLLSAAGWLLSAAMPCASAQSPAPAPEPAKPAAGRDAALESPGSPADLFAALAKDIRPQWRPYYRETVPHAAGDRYKAALALGAISADCYLAAEARDAQQVRNLLSDMAALEMTFSMSRQMSSLRQKPAELAESGDWAAVRTEIAGLMNRHAELLAEQRDQDLAELERIGCWLRSFHVASRFAAKLPRPPGRPCIWSAVFLTALRDRTAPLAARHDTATLRSLLAGLNRLTEIWAGETTAANAAARLAATTPLLDSLMAGLISEESSPPVPVTPPR